MLIKNGADVNARNKLQKTPIFNAHSVELLEFLIKKGADINAINIYGENVLFENPQRKLNMYKIYLDNNCNVNQKDRDGRTILFYNVEYELVKLLVQYGATQNVIDKQGRSVLFNDYCSDDVIRFFIKNGADVNHKDNYGNTPLFNAIFLIHTGFLGNNLELKIHKIKSRIRLLIDHGADIFHKNDAGETVYDYYRKHWKTENYNNSNDSIILIENMLLEQKNYLSKRL